MFNALVGSFSDLHGRRPMILATLFIQILPVMAFVILMMLPHMHPMWYYLTNSLIGGINFNALTFAALSDIIPESMRASSYGLSMAFFYAGYCLAPSLALVLNHFHTALTSLSLVILAFVAAFVFLCETLPDDVREAARQNRARAAATNEETSSSSSRQSVFGKALDVLRRPIDEMSILARDKTLSLLAAGSFFSNMVFAADYTLVLFYVEEQLGVGDKDIASMLLMMGMAGILLQGGAIQPLVRWMGERRLLMATFAFGTFHNFLYGLATTKSTIYIALVVAQLTKLNTPVLSSMASKDASIDEQGRIQGALSASNAIAIALGPLTMEVVYHFSKSKSHLGPGFMFYYAAMLYAVGMLLIYGVPSDHPKRPSPVEDDHHATETPENPLEEPLLSQESENAES